MKKVVFYNILIFIKPIHTTGALLCCGPIDGTGVKLKYEDLRGAARYTHDSETCNQKINFGANSYP